MNQEEQKTLPSSQSLLDSWVWGPQPTSEQLSNFISSVNHEQRKLCSEAANTSLSSTRMHQRQKVLKRYYIALNRAPHTSEIDGNVVLWENTIESSDVKVTTRIDRQKVVQNLDPAVGLARVGSRAALNFSFAFLRRAWRLGKSYVKVDINELNKDKQNSR